MRNSKNDQNFDKNERTRKEREASFTAQQQPTAYCFVSTHHLSDSRIHAQNQSEDDVDSHLPSVATSLCRSIWGMTEIPRFAWFATINKGASSVRHSGESDAVQILYCVDAGQNLYCVRLDPSDAATTMRAIILEKSRCRRLVIEPKFGLGDPHFQVESPQNAKMDAGWRPTS
jgi:hypothetical protein